MTERLPGWAALLLVAACVRTGPEGYSVTTVEGVVEHRYDHVAVPEINPFTVTLTTTYGVGQGADTYIIGGFTEGGVVLMADRSLFAYDSDQRLVHHFDPVGVHLGSFGREGEGPGEFRRLATLTALNGDLIAHDSRSRRISSFDTNGRLLSDHTLDIDIRPFRVIPWSGGDQVSYVGYRSLASEFRGQGEYRFSVYLMAADGNLVDTPVDSVFRYSAPFVSGRSFPQAYTRRFCSVAMGPGLPVAWSYGNEYEVNLYHPDSSTSERLRLLRERRPVTSRLREMAIGSYADRGLEEEARRTLQFPARLQCVLPRAALAVPTGTPLQVPISGRVWGLPGDIGRQ
jgi:hypothetical protein